MDYIIVDGHCDSVLDVASGIRSLAENTNQGHLDFPRLRGRINLQFMALFIESIYKPYGSLLKTLELIDILKQEINKVDYVQPVFTKKHLQVFEKNKVKILITVEGGEALAESINVLHCLFALGVRGLTLTWNQRNALGDGCSEDPEGQGLSKFGRKVIREMNDLGMLVDVSHLAKKSFWDVLKVTNKPIIASHSCCEALCSHPRNLDDQQLKAIAENEGVVGINFYPGFLKEGQDPATIDDVIKHIIHVAEVIGCEYIGLGSDFDGIEKTPLGLEDVTKVPTLILALEKAGFTSKEIANIMGNNFLRIMKKVLPND